MTILYQRGLIQNLCFDSQINNLYALTKIANDKDQDFIKINNSYLDVIEEVGQNSFSVLLLSNYAHFKAFYLYELEEAKLILEDAMNIAGVDQVDLAECKIQYADVLLLSDKNMDALLYYSQVENDFKENPIGHKAKFKKERKNSLLSR